MSHRKRVPCGWKRLSDSLFLPNSFPRICCNNGGSACLTPFSSRTALQGSVAEKGGSACLTPFSHRTSSQESVAERVEVVEGSLIFGQRTFLLTICFPRIPREREYFLENQFSKDQSFKESVARMLEDRCWNPSPMGYRSFTDTISSFIIVGN